MVKKTTLDGLAALVSKGFASADKKFTALAEDMADIKRAMATKDDLRDELKPIRSDLKSIRDELDEIGRASCRERV
jgi:hypothetical protein